jgi:lipopolysaccharide biosynthesis protein
MNRLGIFAHYDAEGVVRDYVLYHLAALRPFCRRLVFVSNAALDDTGRSRALRHCDDVRVRENTGYDFAMWQSVLLDTALDRYDALLLANSSVFGPMFDLEPIVGRMEADECDFWSMTENRDYGWHLQSYFLGFKPGVLRSPVFRRFWETVLPWRNKRQAVRSGEVGLSVLLSEAGFDGRAAFPTRVLRRRFPFSVLYHLRGNPTTCYPGRLLDCGMPYVKTNVLRDNALGVPLRPLRRRIHASGYDTQLIEFDRPPAPRPGRAYPWARHLLFGLSEEWAAVRGMRRP